MNKLKNFYENYLEYYFFVFKIYLKLFLISASGFFILQGIASFLLFYEQIYSEEINFNNLMIGPTIFGIMICFIFGMQIHRYNKLN